MVTAAVGLLLMTVFLAIRIYVKVRIFKRITPDDYVYMISFPAGVVLIALQTVAVTKGPWGFEIWELKVKDLTRSTLIQSFALSMYYGPAMWLIKLTLFWLILTSFRPLRWTRFLVYFGIVSTFLGHSISAIILGFLCRPRGGHGRINYLRGLAEAQPGGTARIASTASHIIIFQAVLSFSADIYLLVLPIPAIWNIRITFKRKLPVYFVFLAGVCACICSLINLIYRLQTFSDAKSNLNVVSGYSLNNLEASIGLIIPCMASVSKLYQHIFHKMNSIQYNNNMGIRNLRNSNIDSLGWPTINDTIELQDNVSTSEISVNTDSAPLNLSLGSVHGIKKISSFEVVFHHETTLLGV
ncbi:hypothetical protein M501DRAFT_137998 [Patellaria atrata CBS 101060]|uniref:Rhodopsin domain-containing protein n=1 Tax=Patellaria atrata CBS 101060 TaxID=1346257 RepID=A0A9P4S7Y9_9PEZI|nr:hypothetical protein M501DRAFT_137998 [Patellaria atrata CBS 101060]